MTTRNKGAGPVSTVQKEQRRNTIALQRKHVELFKKENALFPKFSPRVIIDIDDEKYVGFYEYELYGSKDIYIQFCDKQMNGLSLTLWKWMYNAEFKVEYELSQPQPRTNRRMYLVPIEELIDVTEHHDPKPVVKPEEKPVTLPRFKAPVPEETEPEKEPEEVTEPVQDNLDFTESLGAEEDIPYEAMTLRDYAAIHLKKPCSHRKWLNDLITKTT